MRIVIDGLPLRIRSAGIQTYTYELARCLAKTAGSQELFFSDFCIPLSKAGVGKTSDSEGFRKELQALLRLVPGWWRFVPPAFHDIVNSRRLRAFAPDVYFGPNYFGLFAPTTKTVITIHDLAYMRFPEVIYWFTRRRLRKRLHADALRADAIFADSVATRADVLELLRMPEDKVHVVYPGVGEEFRPVTDQDRLDKVSARYGLPSRFILFVGTVEPRKNLVRLIEAFRLLCHARQFTHSLVIVGGKGWADQPIYQALGPLQAGGRALLTGRVEQDDLPFIYNLADVFVLPSLCEGFGIPVIEAMACGTPVVTSNTSCLPEVAGGAAVLVDPMSAEGIAAGIRSVIDNVEMHKELCQKGLVRASDFSWERAARRVLDVFRQLTGQ
jgi:glycosyltransferase involved in cell wall biosynthesis